MIKYCEDIYPALFTTAIGDIWIWPSWETWIDFDVKTGTRWTRMKVLLCAWQRRDKAVIEICHHSLQ